MFFFHGLIGSHHQASYIADQARQERVSDHRAEPARCRASEFVERKSALEAVGDVEDIAAASAQRVQRDRDFRRDALCPGALYRLGRRIRTVTVISGMGPTRLPAHCTAWTAAGA